jgi:hypothetical protein
LQRLAKPLPVGGHRRALGVSDNIRSARLLP